MENKSKKNIDIIVKIIFVISAILFAIPSIMYIIQNGTVLNFENYFKFMLNNEIREIQTLVYIILLILITLSYAIILKRNKEMFKNIKQILKYVSIVSVIFICIIPFTSSDIFYYMGIGRIAGKYNQNPYYITIEQYIENQEYIPTYNNEQIQNDTVLKQAMNNAWKDSTVVYGPIWTLVCSIFSLISMGNVDIGLLIFKLFNVLIHILNSYLIYKITNKKIFSIIYGLNPYILLEGIMCVHNDMALIFFILVALYFLLKKKKIIPAIAFLAVATAIKYIAILMLPLFIIYNFRDLEPKKRFVNCMKYGGVFVLFLVIPYTLYVRDLNVLAGIITQQGKFAKNYYIIVSIIAKEYFENSGAIMWYLKNLMFIIFLTLFFVNSIKMLFAKKIMFIKESKNLEFIFTIFIFLVITNFQPWYIMWLFPLFMWQNSKNIKLIIQVSILSQFANSIFLLYTEKWTNGIPYAVILVAGTLICVLINNSKKAQKNLKLGN